MKDVSVLSKLHLKYAEKTWNETFQLVHRCMANWREGPKPCEPLVRCLKRLHEALNVTSVSGMVSRLEMIAKQRRMGSHFTEATCYLTADLFYLEVVLLPGGEVDEVKVAQHGEAPVASEVLLKLLRSHRFVEFSVKLGDLFDLYNVPGDDETKIKLFTSLQYLGKDLQKISHLPRAFEESDSRMDVILNGRVGYLAAGTADCPLTIQFYINPSDVLKASHPGISEGESVGHGAQVIVGLSDSTNKLQMASLIPQTPQLDLQGYPVFSPLSEMPHETLPAHFLLKLQPPLPMFSSFVLKLRQITDVAIPDVDLQGALLPKLLTRSSLCAKSFEEAFDQRDNIFIVPLPGETMQSYVFPGAAWEAAALRGTVVGSVPFTHPGHVPALLEVLRHQCAINTLLTSCITARRGSPGSVCSPHLEVLPESDTSFSLTFQRPDTDSLAVLLVNVPESRWLTCSLFAAGLEDSSMDEYISTVMKRCMSIPVTMRELGAKLMKKMPSLLCTPAYPVTIATAEDNPTTSPVVMFCNAHIPSVTESNSTLTTPSAMLSPNATGLEAIPTTTSISDGTLTSPSTMSSQNAMGPEAIPTATSVSACYVMSVATSESVSEINTNPPANPYPCATVSVYSRWVANSHLPELV